jgi:peroxiredoxin
VSTDDRFGDLGEARRQSAAERLAEMDEHGPPEERPPRQPEAPRPRGRYMWVVGVIFLVLIVLAVTRAQRNEGQGLRGPDVGEPLPAFAAPLATGDLNGDANVRQNKDGTDRAGREQACSVRGPDVVNSCELRESGEPVVLTYIVTRGADCEPQLDRVERVRRDFPGVRFVGVVSGDEREKVEKLARKRGWGFPLAVDRDGAVVTLSGVGVCPTTVLAGANGRVKDTKLGNLDDAELRQAVREVAG